jgi:hypothetical protein
VKRLIIELYKEYEKTAFYSIRFETEELCETDRFIERFSKIESFQDDLQIIKKWIEKMGTEKGALERYFRPERNASAIPLEVSDLRLYCIRLSDEVVILGNGGEKTSQAVQDSPDAYPHFIDMNNVYRTLHASLRMGNTLCHGKSLNGQLEFEIPE